jgi:hypothetical protein
LKDLVQYLGNIGMIAVNIAEKAGTQSKRLRHHVSITIRQNQDGAQVMEQVGNLQDIHEVCFSCHQENRDANSIAYLPKSAAQTLDGFMNIQSLLRERRLQHPLEPLRVLVSETFIVQNSSFHTRTKPNQSDCHRLFSFPEATGMPEGVAGFFYA